MKIKTNHHWRQFKYRDEVPANVLSSQFGWTNKANEEYGDYSDGFIEYRGHWYHVGDFLAIRGTEDTPMSDWHGYHANSFFSGVLIRCSDDGEEYQIATYIS